MSWMSSKESTLRRREGRAVSNAAEEPSTMRLKIGHWIYPHGITDDGLDSSLHRARDQKKARVGVKGNG